jgi:hypothetical protein
MICSIDPGLKGGIVLYDFDSPNFVCKETDTSKVKEIKDFIEPYHDQLTHLIIERPIVVKGSAIQTVLISHENFGKILGFFETNFESLEIFTVYPITWTSFFTRKTKMDKEIDVKKKRLNFLCSEYKLPRNLFYTDKNRLQDGLVDAFCLAYFLRESLKR